MCLWWACVGPAGLSSDSGLGGSTDGSTDVLVFESVVDSVTEEGELCDLMVLTKCKFSILTVEADGSCVPCVFVMFRV